MSNESFRNMKLRVTYEKLMDGCIKAKITVIDPGDFPSCYVFNKLANPTNPGYKLWAGNDNTCICTLPTTEDAKKWVDEQIYALRKHLEEWRAIQVPADEEFWI